MSVIEQFCLNFTKLFKVSSYLYVEFKLMEVKPIPKSDISKACGDSYFLPLKLTSDVKLYCGA